MNLYFADAFYFLALLNPRDQANARATAISGSLAGKIFTTEYILIEVADAFSRPPDRPRFLALLELLANDPSFEITPASEILVTEGIDLYRSRPDKEWSLTDCLSFVVMTSRGITQALTGDIHFRQAGFVPML
jgi:uncharacterized protein